MADDLASFVQMSVALTVDRLANLVAERVGSLPTWETALHEGLVKMLNTWAC